MECITYCSTHATVEIVCSNLSVVLQACYVHKSADYLANYNRSEGLTQYINRYYVDTERFSRKCRDCVILLAIEAFKASCWQLWLTRLGYIGAEAWLVRITSCLIEVALVLSSNLKVKERPINFLNLICWHLRDSLRVPRAIVDR